MSDKIKFFLEESKMPKTWYNIAADLPKPLSPVLHPGTLKPVGPDDLAPLFPMALAKQPNGYSDLAEDWMSPELIIRRLIYARQGYIHLKPDNKNNEFFEKVVNKNFDNPDKIMKLLKQNEKPIERHIILFNLPWVFRA